MSDGNDGTWGLRRDGTAYLKRFEDIEPTIDMSDGIRFSESIEDKTTDTYSSVLVIGDGVSATSHVRGVTPIGKQLVIHDSTIKTTNFAVQRANMEVRKARTVEKARWELATIDPTDRTNIDLGLMLVSAQSGGFRYIIRSYSEVEAIAGEIIMMARGGIGSTPPDIKMAEKLADIDRRLNRPPGINPHVHAFQYVNPQWQLDSSDGTTKASILDSAGVEQFGFDSNGNLTLQGTVDTVDIQDHNARHELGGADAIKLDDLSTPDDNTDLDFSTSLHGLVPKGPDDGTFLRADGNWANVELPFTYFLHSDASADIGGYKLLAADPGSDGEATIPTVVNQAGGETLIEEWVTALGVPGITHIQGGSWHFVLYLHVDSAVGVTTVTAKVYKRASGGAETELFTVTTDEINNTSVQEIDKDVVQPDIALLSTDRLVVKLYCTTSSVPNRTVTLTYEGSTNNSHIHTPIVTASAIPTPHASTHSTGGSDAAIISHNHNDANHHPDFGANNHHNENHVIDNVVFHQPATDTVNHDVSIAKHGFCPKLPDDTSQILDGTGNWRLTTQSAFLARKTAANQAVVTDTWVKITFEDEDYDLLGEYAASRFTCVVPGLYHFIAKCGIDGLGDDKAGFVAIYLNGALVLRDREMSGRAGGANVEIDVATDLQLAVDDFVEVYLYHDHGANRDVSNVVGYTLFMGHIVFET